jgi:hypothetical protein
MRSLRNYLPVGILAGLAILGCITPGAEAQFIRRPFMYHRTLPVYSSGVNPSAPFYNPINPLYRVAPGVTSQQALFNTFQPLWAASRLPPWMFGYNPYPPPIYYAPPAPYVPYVPPIYYNPYPNPYLGYSNPYAYSLAAYGATFNPYLLGY